MVLGTMDRPPEGTAWKAVFALKGKHISFCVNWVSWTCLHSWCCLWRKKKQKKEVSEWWEGRCGEDVCISYRVSREDFIYKMTIWTERPEESKGEFTWGSGRRAFEADARTNASGWRWEAMVGDRCWKDCGFYFKVRCDRKVFLNRREIGSD